MNPVFKEYLQFLKDTTQDVRINNLQEGFYWLDRQIIKAFDSKGNIHKIVKINVSKDLNVSTKWYDTKEFIIEDWKTTIEENKSMLDEIELHSIQLIAEKLDKYKDCVPVVFTSTGKDSELTRYLFNKAIYNKNIKPLIIFNNTSMDCSDTYKMAKIIPDCITINPKEGFYKKIKTVGIPTRHHRWCCSLYKEGASKDYLDESGKYVFFYGMRNEESSTRANYQDEKHDDRWAERDWKGILPIRKWTEVQVWLYTLREKIKFNDKYRKGYARVGCAIACPYYTKSTWVLDKYFYPKMYDRFQKFLKDDFLDRQLWCALNCTVEEYPLCWNGGAIRPEPTEEAIQECAEYKKIDIAVARRYFNKTCDSCGNKITKNDVIAMNMKLLGRDVTKFKCKKCLRKFLNISVIKWKEYISDFKTSECNLF